MAPDGIHSRFMPYGVDGMLAGKRLSIDGYRNLEPPWLSNISFSGAASCFFAYVGFDGLATAGEEAKSMFPSYIMMKISSFH